MWIKLSVKKKIINKIKMNMKMRNLRIKKWSELFRRKKIIFF
jgi:hypothetical protein